MWHRCQSRSLTLGINRNIFEFKRLAASDSSLSCGKLEQEWEWGWGEESSVNLYEDRAQVISGVTIPVM